MAIGGSGANWQSGGQWAMQGAQMGSNFGPWGALIGAAAGFVFGKSAPDNEKIMADKYNAEVVKFAARDLFDMRRAQNEENMRTSAAIAQYQDNRKVQTSSITAQMGAADIIGSSANALKQTLDLQTNEAINQTLINAKTGFENYNTRVDQMTNQRIASLQRYKGKAPMDAGKLVSTGVDIYKQFNQDGSLTQGATSMMGAFKNVWSSAGSTSTQGVSGGGLSGMFDSNKGGGGNALAMFNSSVMSA